MKVYDGLLVARAINVASGSSMMLDDIGKFSTMSVPQCTLYHVHRRRPTLMTWSVVVFCLTKTMFRNLAPSLYR